MIAGTKGLDSVEFIMRIEDCFGIAIPDQDAEKIDSVGDLFKYVRKATSAGPPTECLSAKAFYRLRRSLMRLTGRPRNSIRPDTPLAELLPPSARREQWADLAKDLDLILPRLLLFPKDLFLLTGFFAFLLFAIGLAGLTPFVNIYWLPIIFWPLAGLVVAAKIHMSGPYGITFSCPTVGELARAIWAKNFNLDKQPVSNQQIWEAIVNVLSETAGLEASQITPGLRFFDIESDL